jgi:hypothetical protein
MSEREIALFPLGDTLSSPRAHIGQKELFCNRGDASKQMATGQNTQLTGAIGEFLVSAELCRRKLLATPFAGNVPHYDIIASGQSGGHLAVQVKAINGLTWQFDIRKFADVQLCNEKGEQSKDGERQIVGQRKPEPFPDLMCVLVVLKPEATGQDRFFVLEWKELQDILVRSYEAYLTKHGNRRPKAPGSFHTALAIDQAKPFEDKWDKICDRVPKPPPA